MTLEAQFDENYVLSGWNVVADSEVVNTAVLEGLADQPLLSSNVSLEAAKAELEKVNGVSGPFSDAMFNPFVVVYGTQGTEAQNADSLRAAQELRWSGTTGSYCTLETTEVIEQPFLCQMCGKVFQISLLWH